MLATCLLTLGAWLAAPEGPGPAEWVGRLGSGRFADRVEAARALEKLGRDALPALIAAKDSPDPRVRARVASLLETIAKQAEGDRATRPTTIRLDFRDRPLSEIVAELNARHHLGLEFQFGPLPGRSQRIFTSAEEKARQAEAVARRVTLEAPDPVPFWEAIDRLCGAGGLRHDLHPQGRFGLSAGRFLLYSGLGGTLVASDDGPFRVRVVGLRSTFERDFTGSPNRAVRSQGARPADRELNVRMVVIPEPGRVIRQVGPPALAVAVDDQGRDLLPPEGPPEPSPAIRQAPSLNGPAGFDLFVPLRLPEVPGRSIRRFRGSVPVVVVAHAPDPIVLPLPGSVGKSARDDEVTVTVHEVATDAGGGVTVEVGVVPHRPPTPEDFSGQGSGTPDFASFRTGQLTQRLELLDARGRELAMDWSQGHGRDMASMNTRIRLTPRAIQEDQPPDPAGRPRPPLVRKPVPVEVRYHGFTQTPTVIGFDLRDIPLP